MDVTLLWFQCSNPDCGYIPLKTKKDKIQRAWRYGKSITENARARMFMRYVEGYYVRKENGNLLLFECKYGSIVMYDGSEIQICNNYSFPIKDKEMCQPCLNKIKNERALYQ